MSAIRRAEIGSRGFALRSWRAYGNHGMTAVIRLADASVAAWIISSSSIRFLSTGAQPVWTMKTSAPRIDSSNRQYVSSFPNVCSSIAPSSTPSCSPIALARSGCERPAKTISRFCGPRSIQWPGLMTAAGSAGSRPGSRSVSSVVALSMPVVDVAPFRDLPGRESCQRARRDIFCDHRTCCNPSVVPDLDRCNERIVDSGPDVAADPRPFLRLAGLVVEVGGHVSGADVRARADLRVAHVREVRHLRALADARVLQLDERAGLRARGEHGAGAQVAER